MTWGRGCRRGAEEGAALRQGATWGWGCAESGVRGPRRALRPERPEGRSSRVGPLRGQVGGPWPRSRALPRTLPRSLARPLLPRPPAGPAALTGPAARQQSQRATAAASWARALPAPAAPAPPPARALPGTSALFRPPAPPQNPAAATLPGHAAGVRARGGPASRSLARSWGSSNNRTSPAAELWSDAR